jgi:hypothetical protein
VQSLFRERFLTFQDVLSCRSDGKPAAAIDLGKLSEPSRARGPEGIIVELAERIG